jgi:hypothetical protein
LNHFVTETHIDPHYVLAEDCIYHFSACLRSSRCSSFVCTGRSILMLFTMLIF